MFFGRRRRRAKWRETPAPEGWDAILRKRAPRDATLPDDVRARTLGHMQVLLAEKHFEGCGGLELTDEHRVTIAFSAALMLGGWEEPTYYKDLRTVLVYPDAYIAPFEQELDDGTVIAGDDQRAGESWGEGLVVLSWRDILDDVRRPHDGLNVIMHEFAHQLDGETGDEDGAPRVADPDVASRWRAVMLEAYNALCEAADAGRPTVIDPYGAENPAEFFAVCVEAFFHASHALATTRPALYDLLRGFFLLDPASWDEPRRPRLRL